MKKRLLLLTLLFGILPFLASAQTVFSTWASDVQYDVDTMTYKYKVTSVPTTSQNVAGGVIIYTGIRPGTWTLHGFSTTFTFIINNAGAIVFPPTGPGGPAIQNGKYEAIFAETISLPEVAQQPAFNYVAEYPSTNLLPANSKPIKAHLFITQPNPQPNDLPQWHDDVQLTPYFFWNNVEGWFAGTALAAIVVPYPNTRPTNYTDLENVPLVPMAEKYKDCVLCPTCPGMTGYSLDRLHGSFSLNDTPVSYSPPVGPGVGFTITYNQMDVGQLPVQPFSNIGANWTYSALAYITNRPDDQNASVTRFVPGGGLEYYDLFTIPPTATGVFDPKTSRYSFPQTSAPERNSRAVLSWNPTLSQYTRTLANGGSELYGKWINSGGTNYYLLTQKINAQGNTVSYGYDSQGRLITITDAIGQVTTYSYNSSISPMLITKVTDPFGRSASLQYDTQGRLTSCTDPLGMVSSYGYDSNNNVISLTTPYGTTTFSIDTDALHSGVTVTNPLGQPERVELRYGSVSSISDSDPAAPNFNSAYLPTGYTAPLNSGLSSNNSFFWDRKQYAAHSPIQYTDAQITHWQPGPHGLTPAPASSKQPLENRVWYVYQGQATPGYLDDSDQTNPVATGRILDDGSTQASYAVYNLQGNITQTVDPIGRTTNMTYDPTGIDLLSTSQVNGPGNDLLQTMTYTNGAQPTSTHLPLSGTNSSGQTTYMTYNSQGQILTAKDALGEITTYSYTGNYLTTMTAPMTGATTTYTYDSVGRVSTVTDSEGYTMTYNYDSLDRAVKIIYPDGTFKQTVFQNLDPVQMIDRQGRISTKTYDAIREVLSVTDPLNRTTQYTWCLCGGLASLTDANHNVTQFALDLQGRVTAKTYSDSSQFTYTYENTTSRLHQMQDANGNTAVYVYNEDNTLSGSVYTSGTGVAATPNVSFTYDPSYNRVTSMMDGVGATTYKYNPVPTALPTTGANMLGSISVPIGAGNGTASVGAASVAYTYDALGRASNYAIDGGNNSTSLTYDSLSRVTNINNPLGAFVYAYINTTGRLKTLTYPASTGLVTNLSFFPNVSPGGTGNGDQRLQEISNAVGTTNLSNFEYTYNPVGTMATWQQQTDANVATQYALTNDAADQLVNAVNKNTSTNSVVNSNAYQFDLMGNRLAEVTQSATNVGRFNNLNQLTAFTLSAVTQTISGTTNVPVASATINTVPATVSGTTFTANVPVPAGTNVITVGAQNGSSSASQKVQIVTPGGTIPTPVSYDKNGNTLTDEAGNTYSWDALNRLVTITYPGGATSNFAYDGDSRRIAIIEKNNSGTVTTTKLYVWLGNGIAEERNTSNSVQKRFYSQGEQQSGTNYFYTRDHLGSVRELISSTGTVISRLSYDVNGVTTIVSGSTLPTFQYAGYYFHAASSLYLTKFRAYNTRTTRWLSRDPKGGLNPYDYCRNESINSYDTLGLTPNVDVTTPSATQQEVLGPIGPLQIPTLIRFNDIQCRGQLVVRQWKTVMLEVPNFISATLYPDIGESGDNQLMQLNPPEPGSGIDAPGYGNTWPYLFSTNFGRIFPLQLYEYFETCVYCKCNGRETLVGCVHWAIISGTITSRAGGGVGLNLQPALHHGP